MVLRLVGIGLGTPDYLTLKALRALEESDIVYLDCYTSIISSELIEFLRLRLGGRLVLAERSDLEEGVAEIVKRAKSMSVTVAVPGDPLMATTHVVFLEEAVKEGVTFEVIHGASSITAAIGASGLSSYKFGRIVTVPKNAGEESLKTICRCVEENMESGLHTLVLLDVADGGLRAAEALGSLLMVAAEMGGSFGPQTPVIILARLGYGDEFRVVCRASEAGGLSLPPPPHVVIVPAETRSYEREAVKALTVRGGELLDTYRPTSRRRARAERYIAKTSGVLSKLAAARNDAETSKILELVNSYVEDARHFLDSGMLDDSLIAISYAEGLLDCLRIIGRVEFTW